MSFFDDILNDALSASDIAARTTAGVYDTGGGFGDFSLSGSLQGLLNVGTRYANGVADLELAKRAVRIQQQAQQPDLMGTQSLIGYQPDLTSRGVSAVGGVRLGNILPFILLGLGAYALLKKG